MITENDVRAAIKQSVAGFDVNRLLAETRFSDAGLDSLDSFNILLAVMENHGVDFPDSCMSRLNSIQRILEFSNSGAGALESSSVHPHGRD